MSESTNQQQSPCRSVYFFFFPSTCKQIKYRRKSVFWWDMEDQGIRADFPDEIPAKLDETQGWGVQRQINISTFCSFASLLVSPGSQGRDDESTQTNTMTRTTYALLNPEAYQDFLIYLFWICSAEARQHSSWQTRVRVCCSCCLQGVNRQTSIQSATDVFTEGEPSSLLLLSLAHLLLLPPLPAQLSISRRHGLDHKRGGHVAGERSRVLRTGLCLSHE